MSKRLWLLARAIRECEGFEEAIASRGIEGRSVWEGGLARTTDICDGFAADPRQDFILSWALLAEDAGDVSVELYLSWGDRRNHLVTVSHCHRLVDTDADGDLWTVDVFKEMGDRKLRALHELVLDYRFNCGAAERVPQHEIWEFIAALADFYAKLSEK